MKIVKNLSVANIRKYEGFERREDLDFSDDGNYFRGFSYKGMPITTLRCNKDNTTYLSIRVDYLENKFTHKDWIAANGWVLCDKFNGVSEFAMEDLIEILEEVIAKVEEMNAAAEAEDIDVTEVVDAMFNEVVMAEAVVNNFKANFKWYDASSHELSRLVRYMKAVEAEIDRVNKIKVNELTNKQKKEMVQRLNEHGYVKIRKDSFYLNELINATK